MIEPDPLTAGLHLDLATQAHASDNALFWRPVATGRLMTQLVTLEINHD